MQSHRHTNQIMTESLDSEGEKQKRTNRRKSTKKCRKMKIDIT